MEQQHGDQIQIPNQPGASATVIMDGREYQGLPPGRYRWVTTVSAITFVMILCLMFFGALMWLVKDTLVQASKREEKLTDVIGSLQASINANNHNLAGMTNVVNQVIEEVRSLKMDVKSLNRVAARIPSPAEPMKAEAKADRPE